MRRKIRGLWKLPVILPIVALFLCPFIILANVAMRPSTDLRSYWAPPLSVTIENFDNAIQKAHVFNTMGNSAIVTVCAVLLIVIAGSFAAYPLARQKDKFNKGIRLFVLGILMIPPLSILVSLYSVLVSLSAINTYWGLILVLVTFQLPTAIFLYTNFIKSLPVALDEAAAIDGCGPIRTFFQIILPQLKPVTVSVMILTGVACWNDYQMSLYIMQSSKKYTVSLAVASFFSQGNSDLYAAAAAALIAIAPPVLAFLFLQKYFMQGVVDSAVK